MKRYGNLIHLIYDKKNLALAHKNARKGKTSRDENGISKPYKEITEVDNNRIKYLDKIHNDLKNGTYVNSEYKMFIKHTGNKDREIFKLPYYPDRIVHHAIMQVLEPIWKKTLINDTYQSIKGRGVHRCKNKIEPIVRNESLGIKYSLKIDIKKFYPSIDNKILKQIIRKKIKCYGTLNLLDSIIDSIDGVPIGNYISQYFGNLYLTYLDHFIKEEVKAKYYYRYCDDILVLGTNKEELHQILFQIKQYIINNLNIEIKDNYQISPIDIRGIDFLGFRMFNNRTLLRKNIATNFKRASKANKDISSYYGWIKNSSSNNLWYKQMNCNNYRELKELKEG